MHSIHLRVFFISIVNLAGKFVDPFQCCTTWESASEPLSTMSSGYKIAWKGLFHTLLRPMVSGIFDAYPTLKIIIGIAGRDCHLC